MYDDKKQMVRTKRFYGLAVINMMTGDSTQRTAVCAVPYAITRHYVVPKLYPRRKTLSHILRVTIAGWCLGYVG